MSNKQQSGDASSDSLDRLERLVLANEYRDLLDDVRGRSFRVRQFDDLDIGDVRRLQHAGIIEIDEELEGWNRVHDYRLTQVGEETLDKLEEIDAETIPDPESLDRIRSNADAIHRLPDEPDEEFRASDVGLYGRALSSLSHAGVIECITPRENAPNTWATTGALDELRGWIE